MDVQWMAKQLPEEPPKGLIRWASDTAPSELNEDITVITGERIRTSVTMMELFDNQTTGKSVWAEHCVCTVCGESYYAAKVPGMDAFYCVIGEDETAYPIDPGENPDESIRNGFPVIAVNQNDRIECPLCCNETVVYSSKQIRGGRRKQIQVASLHQACTEWASMA